MCPLWPLHILLLYVLCVAPLLLMAQHVKNDTVLSKQLKVAFDSEMDNKMTEGETKTIQFYVSNMEDYNQDVDSLELEVTSSDTKVASAELLCGKNFTPNTNWTGDFKLTAKFLGYANILINLRQAKGKELVAESEPRKISVIRIPRVVDKAFIYTVAILVSIAFVNMGCMLDLQIVKATLKKPIGPAIGFCCQYIFMPLCAFALARMLLSHSVALQLGLFVTGCSPGGGGSNIWTFILGGNLHLSVTMTFLSTIAAFAMMPFWTMTLGRLIFAEGHIVVPYRNIATLAAGLVIPLMIGVLIRRFLPKTAEVLAKALKPIAGIFVLVIIGFGIYTNLFLLELIDGPVLLSSMSLVLLGYSFGGLAAFLLRQSWPDALTVAIETGVQNTGIAIFILRVTLDQPEADINTVVPVAVAIMTPFPLIILWVLQRFILSRYGICVVPKQETKSCPVMLEASSLNNQSASSVQKLLPNNNDATPVVVKVLTED